MSIEEDIGTVVNAMRGNSVVDSMFDESLQGLAPFYLHGHRLEIVNLTTQKGNDMVEKFQKYPLFALREDVAPVRKGNVYEWNLNIAILHETEKNYTSAERNEKVFKPVLEPLYKLFLEKIRKAGLFFWPGDQSAPPHIPIKRKFYGITDTESNTRYIFNEPVDAIELINFRLNQKIKNC